MDTLSLVFKKLPRELWDGAIDDIEDCASEPFYAFAMCKGHARDTGRNESAYVTRAIDETYAILSREGFFGGKKTP